MNITVNETRGWPWGEGDAVNAVIGARLELKCPKERAEGVFPAAPEYEVNEQGHSRLPTFLHGHSPLTSTVKARKSQ